MSDVIASGKEVRAQARDTSIMNTNPAIVVGVATQLIGSVGAVLIVFGFLNVEQQAELVKQAAIIIPAFFTVLGLISGVITRARVWSPKSAAMTAVQNADAAAMQPPVLVAA